LHQPQLDPKRATNVARTLIDWPRGAQMYGAQMYSAPDVLDVILDR
jgi:hypothetical protein